MLANENTANRIDADDDHVDGPLGSTNDRSGLTHQVRRQLLGEVRAAGGNVDSTVQRLRTRIAEIDGTEVPEDDPQHSQIQAERALLVAQVTFLEDQVATGNWDLNEPDARDSTVDSPRSEWDESSKVGTAGGTLAGAATGAAIGSVGGPVGTVVGGVAGAATGAGVGAAGDAVGEAAKDAAVGEDDAAYPRTGRARVYGE